MFSESEVYVSTDVETDGPIPGPFSMLSLGSAAYLPDKTLLGTFCANLEPLPGATQHPTAMRWWSEVPEAWQAAREGARDPAGVMRDYSRWLRSLPGKLVFVGYPAGFDFTFVYWYLVRFTGESPFRHSALDIKTYAMAVLKKPFRQTNKQSMPRRWFGDGQHTHHALQDAIEQGILFCNMLAENCTTRQVPDVREGSPRAS